MILPIPGAAANKVVRLYSMQFRDPEEELAALKFGNHDGDEKNRQKNKLACLPKGLHNLARFLPKPSGRCVTSDQYIKNEAEISASFENQIGCAGYYGRLNALTRKTAICARPTIASGQ